MSFVILIPTYKRLTNQETLRSLSPELRAKTTVVCRVHEEEPLREYIDRNFRDHEGNPVKIMTQPTTVTTISTKRAWMMQWARENGIDKVLMLDDDLFFYYRYWKQEARNGAGDWRLLGSTDEQTNKWIPELMDSISAEVPHGGFGQRQGNQNFGTGWKIGASRVLQSLAYHVPTVLDNAKIDRMGTREDMDVTLQLLRAGLPNIVTHDFVVGQKEHAAPGGCTDQRTVAVSDADAYILAELHPGFVRVVDRQYKHLPRKEVIIQWKKALISGGYKF